MIASRESVASAIDQNDIPLVADTYVYTITGLTTAQKGDVHTIICERCCGQNFQGSEGKTRLSSEMHSIGHLAQRIQSDNRSNNSTFVDTLRTRTKSYFVDLSYMCSGL